MTTKPATKRKEEQSDNAQKDDQNDLLEQLTADVPIEEVAIGVRAITRMVARRMAQGFKRVST